MVLAKRALDELRRSPRAPLHSACDERQTHRAEHLPGISDVRNTAVQQPIRDLDDSAAKATEIRQKRQSEFATLTASNMRPRCSSQARYPRGVEQSRGAQVAHCGTLRPHRHSSVGVQLLQADRLEEVGQEYQDKLPTTECHDRCLVEVCC